MKKLISILTLSFMLIGGLAHAETKPSPLSEKQAIELLQGSQAVYSCTMKDNWFSDKPGKCPCCSMDLEKVKEIKNGKAIFEENKDTNKEKM